MVKHGRFPKDPKHTSSLVKKLPITKQVRVMKYPAQSS